MNYKPHFFNFLPQIPLKKCHTDLTDPTDYFFQMIVISMTALLESV